MEIKKIVWLGLTGLILFACHGKNKTTAVPPEPAIATWTETGRQTIIRNPSYLITLNVSGIVRNDGDLSAYLVTVIVPVSRRGVRTNEQTTSLTPSTLEPSTQSNFSFSVDLNKNCDTLKQVYCTWQ